MDSDIEGFCFTLSKFLILATTLATLLENSLSTLAFFSIILASNSSVG